MKLCIVKPDGTTAEILMFEREPCLETINNELLLFENYHYRLIIRGNEDVDNIEMFVGDYSLQVHYNSVTDCFETETELVFCDCFDLACISVYVDNGEGGERIFYSDFLRIATTKQTAIQVEQMLGEIEENLPNFLEICFSRNRKKSGLIKNNIRSIWNTLKIVDEIIMVYEENYGYFSNHKKAYVEPVAAIVDAKAMKIINQESLRWIACNPGNLIQTDKNSGIVVKDKNFIPSKVKTYLSKYSYDVYENRVVLGFLQNIIDYLDNQILCFNKEIIVLENVPESIVVQLPNTHELTGRCVYIYYKGIIERFDAERSVLQEIYYRYERVLECPAERIYATPKLTNTFKQIYHYRLCYECMFKWFQSGDYTFNHLNYLFKLKTLSRIFEYFCLIKLQTALGESGYILQEANRIEYDIEDVVEDINNQYVFIGNGYEVTLLYEPFIWVDKVNEGMNLYSTGYNFSKNRWNDKWTPDFVLKISSSSYRDYYYILDAKYSNAQNVKKRYMSDLVLKYSTQIASKDKFITDVIGVGAIYPGDEDKMYYFKKNTVGSQKQSLPSYFSLAIIGENVGNNMLKNRLAELLKVVEVIEKERENVEALKERTEQLTITHGKNIVHDTNTLIDTTLASIEEMPLKDKQNMYFSAEKGIVCDHKDLVIKVDGKKCFYYAKNMCMCQKVRCYIGDEPCTFYVSKKSKKLLKEEDTCRNFIHYTRRGKVIRVECSVLGLPGCIGSDDCKFYMRKNKSKK